MGGGSPIEHVLRHNTWANVTLLEFCRDLEPALLEAHATGTYGTLYGTLQHVVGAEQWYVQLITGEVLGPGRIRRDERRPLDDLLATARAVGVAVPTGGTRSTGYTLEVAWGARASRGRAPAARR